MKNNKSPMIIIIVIVILLAGAYVIYHMLGSSAVPGAAGNGTGGELTPAPDFTVVNEEGEKVSLSDFLGKPVVLNFWASWCGPCKSEMPGFDAMFEEYGDEISFMMVNLTDGSRETAETARRYIQEEGYDFSVYYDTEISAASAYGVSSIPVTYFIDEEGNLVTYAMGAIDEASLQNAAESLLE